MSVGKDIGIRIGIGVGVEISGFIFNVEIFWEYNDVYAKKRSIEMSFFGFKPCSSSVQRM